MKLPQEYDLHALEVFVMTVELGGMSQCAAHLQVTQSAVSQTIARLEAGIGASLFDRTMRPLGLTASGKSLFARGHKLIAHARQKAHDGVICGHFHVAALHNRHGLVYANCGDWVENATALVETANGRLLLIDWEAHGVETSAASRLPLEMTASPVHMGFAQAAHP